MKKIVLIGMMGCGKSAVSKKLEELTKIKRYELDEIFEEKYFKIADFFKKEGEEKFRKIETELLIETLKNPEFIISTGGGVILKEENRALIFTPKIFSIYLSAKPETIYERIKEDKTRPLLLVDNPKAEIEKILKAREGFYKQATVEFKTDNKTIDEIAEEIYEKYINKN